MDDVMDELLLEVWGTLSDIEIGVSRCLNSSNGVENAYQFLVLER